MLISSVGLAVLGWVLPLELLEGLLAPIEAAASALLSPVVSLLTPLARLLGALVIDPGFEAPKRTDADAPSMLLSLLAGGLPLSLAIAVLVRDQRWRAAALRSQLGVWAGLTIGRSPAPAESEAQAAARALLEGLGVEAVVGRVDHAHGDRHGDQSTTRGEAAATVKGRARRRPAQAGPAPLKPPRPTETPLQSER